MKKTLILIFVFLTLDFLGQIDSTIYYTYSKDPDVTKIKYITKYYSNHKLKEEGWIVLYKNAENSKIFKVINADPNTEYNLKVGIWYGYYKDGKHKYIDTIYIGENFSGNIYTVFSRTQQKVAEKHYNSNQKEIDNKNTTVLFGQLYEKNSNKASGNLTTSIYYYTNGQIHYIENYCNNRHCGTDKFYSENGILIKEKKYNYP